MSETTINYTLIYGPISKANEALAERQTSLPGVERVFGFSPKAKRRGEPLFKHKRMWWVAVKQRQKK